MFKVDEDALICDLAECYGIYDYRSIQAGTIAVLACGLREGARIKNVLLDSRYTYDEVMKAVIVDRLNWLCWSKTKDAKNGWNRPESLAKKMMTKPKVHKAQGFGTVEDFMEWRKKFVEG